MSGLPSITALMKLTKHELGAVLQDFLLDRFIRGDNVNVFIHELISFYRSYEKYNILPCYTLKDIRKTMILRDVMETAVPAFMIIDVDFKIYLTLYEYIGASIYHLDIPRQNPRKLQEPTEPFGTLVTIDKSFFKRTNNNNNIINDSINKPKSVDKKLVKMELKCNDVTVGDTVGDTVDVSESSSDAKMKGIVNNFVKDVRMKNNSVFAKPKIDINTQSGFKENKLRYKNGKHNKKLETKYRVKTPKRKDDGYTVIEGIIALPLNRNNTQGIIKYKYKNKSRTITFGDDKRANWQRHMFFRFNDRVRMYFKVHTSKRVKLEYVVLLDPMYKRGYHGFLYMRNGKFYLECESINTAYIELNPLTCIDKKTQKQLLKPYKLLNHWFVFDIDKYNVKTKYSSNIFATRIRQIRVSNKWYNGTIIAVPPVNEAHNAVIFGYGKIRYKYGVIRFATAFLDDKKYAPNIGDKVTFKVQKFITSVYDDIDDSACYINKI